MLLKNAWHAYNWPIRVCPLTRSYAVVVPDRDFIKAVANEDYKPRHHPGRVDHKVVSIPDTFVKAVLSTIEDYPLKGLMESASKLSRQLHGRQLPFSQQALQDKLNKLQQRVVNQYKHVEVDGEEEVRRFRQKLNDKFKEAIRQEVYNWKPIKYDMYTCLMYLVARAPAEYAVLTKIFSEIVNLDKDFAPRSLFDYGSGVGTVTWAVNAFWKSQIFEYMNIDSSAEMNDLAEILLKGGKGNGKSPIKGTFYRQFLPASNIEYDLVVSAYSLMELPTMEMRLETILNLWNKTQHYLVVVEQGTNAGFKIVNEVRDFLLQLDNVANQGHVFSPCPHDLTCPRFLANDGTPCNFNARYWTMPIGRKPEVANERYSYVVMKKGKRPDKQNWPRIVRPNVVKAKHTHCHMCTANGQLRHAIFTLKRQGK